MTRQPVARAIVLAIALAAHGCANPNTSPTAPSTSLFSAQAGGIWVGSLTPTGSVARFNRPLEGQACVNENLIEAVGHSATATLSLTQEGSNLTGRMTAELVGLSCNFTGSTSLTTMTLDATECDATELLVQCRDGTVALMRLRGSSILATVRAGSVEGTVASTYNVETLGSFVVNSNLSASKR
jgi:hypothetical protein